MSPPRKYSRWLAAAALSLLGIGCLATFPDNPLDPGILLLSGNSYSSGTISISSTSSLYTGFDDWNDYIENDGTHRLNATGTACTAGTTGGYSACIHAGVMKSVTITNRSSCDGISAEDSESALFWACDDSSGSIRVVSLGFIPGKGLGDLIDFSTGTWKSMTVTVTDSTGSTTSEAARWWSNSIVLNPTGGPITANISGTIYAFSASPNAQVVIGADKVSVVSDKNYFWYATGGGVDMITATGFKYLWLEPGWMNGNGADTRAVYFNNVSYSVMQLTFVQNTTSNLIELSNSNNNYLFLVEAAYSTAGQGLVLDGSSFNTLGFIVVNNASSHGLRFTNLSNNNSVSNVIATSNGGSNIYIFNSTNNALLNVSSASSASSGLAFDTNSTNNTLFNFAMVNNSWGITTGSTSHRNSFAHFGITHSPNTAYTLGSDNNYFTGVMRVGNNGTNCAATGTLSGMDNACVQNGSSIFTAQTGSDFSSSFGSGTGTTGTNPPNWILFSDYYRVWSRAGVATYPDSSQSGFCTAATCETYDWWLSASDSQLLNQHAVPDGNVALPHLWNVANQTECETIDRASWTTGVCSYPGYNTSGTCTGAGGDWSSSKCVSVFLGQSYELSGDSFGNDNGICESYEICVYSPNMGAYQGEGGLTSLGSITDGTIKSVQLFQFNSNGR